MIFCGFQIDRQLVVTTGEKIAQVGRIDQEEAEPEAEPEAGPEVAAAVSAEPEAGSAMQPALNTCEWNDDHRLVISTTPTTTITTSFSIH